MVYVQLLEGESPARARPILVTGDPRVVADVTDALGRRLGLRPSTDDELAWDAEALAAAEAEGARR